MTTTTTTSSEFDVLFFAEALDMFKEANEAHDNNPEGDNDSDTWAARKAALRDLHDAFKDAVRAVQENKHGNK